ncbi:hypothetical protein OJF2_17460 [Aquisphaera giovannonii]|uniref:Zinc-finger domain-containing protein n=1 Tax=Aquisphaera giovannonii TaxID=406548 RepID=A0A5B9VXY6_9BACT|nr:hypothetical protein [Aquisphaera giovannonii]QEH33246.1 hypothetical protein OJF2_17460 [Aquisphaera giovannonii]
MDCREFDRRWDDLLDRETAARAGGGGAAGPDRRLAEHAATCPRCKPIHARYVLLRAAIRAWTPSIPGTAPSPELIDRVLASASVPTAARPRVYRRLSRPGALVAGAIAAAAIAVLLTPITGPRPLPRGPRAPESKPKLSEALAGATAATWGLAESTTGEAARFGRQVIGAAATSGDEAVPVAADDEGSPLSFLSFSPALHERSDESSAGWLQDVGAGLSSSVRPLSSTAERAFGFLRVRASARVRPDSPPSSKGA